MPPSCRTPRMQPAQVFVLCLRGLHGSSGVVLSRAIRMVTLLRTLFGVLRTLRISNHEPPSRVAWRHLLSVLTFPV